ncbi:MAG: hypothetical protein JWL61_3483 [Gemmatimonadetes bacterium]|nr:hypothetical protein [Gemmatimonadota bacterium]
MSTVHQALLSVHIAMGAVGLVSGAGAMMLRKGSRGHRYSGHAFFVSMLAMSALGAFIAAVLKPSMGNVMGGLLTFYLVLTAWTTVWRKPGETGALEIGGALLGFATFVAAVVWARAASFAPTHRFGGYPAAFFMVFGGVVFFATFLDVRMIIRGGLRGNARIMRHLWRMCVAMFIATSSFFLGLASKRFPIAVRESGLTVVPVILVVVALLYFVLRIRIVPIWRKRRAVRLAASS